MTVTYIIAVSGGIDSTVLLHKLTSVKPPNMTYVVAHVNHGIRPTSDKDEEFVRALAKTYGCKCEVTKLHLGSEASEDDARKARYDYLHRVRKKYKAEAIITAHHEDDVIETMILNLLRGTGYRGLVGFTQPYIVRPFLYKPKAELYRYAADNHLQWREDESNNDTKYLRNHVRKNMMPRITDREKWLVVRDNIAQLQREIDDLSKKLLVQTMHKGELSRARFVILPYIVQKELLATWFRLEGLEIDQKMIESAVRACKVFGVHSQHTLTKDVFLLCGKKTIVLKST